jgi:ribonuclease HII
MKIWCTVGIDEVGRGPLAGPVSVGIFLIQNKNLKNQEIKSLVKVANDSKKLSPKKREEIFEKVKLLQKSNLLQYIVVNQSASFIDKKGINTAISFCIKNGLKKLKVLPNETQVYLDGGLKADKKYLYQETIIKGDAKNKFIALASIVAKVSRDKLMTKVSKMYPEYGFEVHKGYGTAKHRKAIQKYGVSKVHRLSFCKSIDFSEPLV